MTGRADGSGSGSVTDIRSFEFFVSARPSVTHEMAGPIVRVATSNQILEPGEHPRDRVGNPPAVKEDLEIYPFPADL